jgi:hypothetical protein
MPIRVLARSVRLAVDSGAFDQPGNQRDVPTAALRAAKAALLAVVVDGANHL